MCCFFKYHGLRGKLEISKTPAYHMERVAYLTEFFPETRLGIAEWFPMVNRDSAPRRARRWCVQFDVGGLFPNK